MKPKWKGLVILAAGLLAACMSPSSTRDPTSPPTTGTMGPFPAGVYFGSPDGDGHRLVHLDLEIPRETRFTGVGFDVSAHAFVATEGTSSMRVVRSSGLSEAVPTPGVYHVARPSLATDGNRIVFQGSENPGSENGPADLNIYLLDLETRAVTRLSHEPVNEESPEWVPTRNWVVWSSFDPEAGIDAHVFDPVAGSEILTIPDAGAIHLAVSDDGERLLDPGRMRIYNLSTGALLEDMREEALDGLSESGYRPDDRFPGQAGRGTFPLDGDFSPDGTRIVFDGAVQRDGSYGVLLMEIGLDGSGFRVLAPLVEVDPSQSNDHNFSQLNPEWI